MKRFSAVLAMASLLILLTACGGNSSDSNSKVKDGEAGTATDQQGQTFATIGIGSQLWMAENLNTTQFSNGDPIKEANSWEAWDAAGKAQEPAWCYYEFNVDNEPKYGKLYNWFAVNDERGLAPEGWSIPSAEDWDKLQNHLGEGAGNAMKTAEGWNNDGNGDNSRGFNAVPAGAMNPSSMNVGNVAYWWTQNEADEQNAHTRFIGYWANDLEEGAYGKVNGFSVRCVK